MKQSSDSLQETTMTNRCSKCNGTGWQFVDYNTVVECDCGLIEKQRMESKLQFAMIPTTYKDVRLEDISTKFYRQKASKDIIKAISKSIAWYLDNLYENIEEGKGLYLWSDTKGSGKTMMAAAIANELINKHRRYVKFATSLDILDEIKATYGRRYRDEEESAESKLLKDLVSAEFLVIDDFGTERATDWAGEKFYQIVNKRYINQKVTFFTSNFDLRELKYDDRITNRIRERSFIIHFPEESVREFKAKLDDKRIGV